MRKRKIMGFVLHFGYVESSRASALILFYSGSGGGFSSLRKALPDLAHYFWDDYVGRLRESSAATIEEFAQFLYEMPTFVASGGPGSISFDSEHVNEERWWPWNTLREMLPMIDQYVEIPECAEKAIIWSLDEEKLDEKLQAELRVWKANRIEPRWKEMKRVYDR